MAEASDQHLELYAYPKARHRERVLREQTAESLMASCSEAVPRVVCDELARWTIGWIDGIESGDTDATCENIIETIEGLEADYPNERTWDRVRITFARDVFVVHGDIEKSAKLVGFVRDPYNAVLTYHHHSHRFEGTDEERRDKVFLYFCELERNFNLHDPQRMVDFVRHLRNFTIRTLAETVPKLSIEFLDEYLASRVPDYDSVQDWIEIEAFNQPEVEWPGLAAILLDDDLWNIEEIEGDDGEPIEITPFKPRHHIVAVYTALLSEALAGDSDLKEGRRFEPLRRTMKRWQAEDDADAAWDYLRLHAAGILFRRGELKHGDIIARDITDPHLMGFAVEQLWAAGHGDKAATQLILAIPSARVVTTMLCYGSWEDPEAARRQLDDILTSNIYPPQLRLGCLAALRDMHAASGEPGGTELAAELEKRRVLLAWQYKNAPNIAKFTPKSGARWPNYPEDGS